MVIYFRSSIQNANNRRLRIWKNKCIIDLINNEPGISKIHLYTKNPCGSRYQLLINKRQCTGFKHFNDPKPFIEYSNVMQDIYKNIDEYNVVKNVKY